MIKIGQTFKGVEIFGIIIATRKSMEHSNIVLTTCQSEVGDLEVYYD